MGAICSLIMFILVGSFAIFKLDIVYNRKFQKEYTFTFEEHYKSSDVFGHEQGLNFAVALYGKYDDSIGKLVFYERLLEDSPQEGFEMKRREIESHICSK